MDTKYQDVINHARVLEEIREKRGVNPARLGEQPDQDAGLPPRRRKERKEGWREASKTTVQSSGGSVSLSQESHFPQIWAYLNIPTILSP